MSGDHALGIDIGTSGVRAALLAPSGEIVAEGAARMADHGGRLRSPAVWRDTLAAALSALFDQVNPSLVGAVAVDGTSGTVLALDRDGEPVGEALMYNDAVDDAAIVAAIAAVAPRESAAHGASSGLARALALRSRPSVARILHQAEWIAEILAGQAVASDESNALKTGYDPIGRCWPNWIELTGMKLDLLPPVVPAGTCTGACSGVFGLPKCAALVAGVTDGCASFLATGAERPGDGVTALGTTLTVKLLSDAPVFAPEFGIYSHRIGDMWLAGGASNTGGGVLAAHFEPEALDILTKQVDPERPTGLDYYPLVRPGERFPVSDPEFSPRLEPRPATDAEFLQAILEGMARIEAEGFRKLHELGAPRLASIRTVGGGAVNPAWRKLRLAALGVPELEAASTSAAAGVARLAANYLASRALSDQSAREFRSGSPVFQQ